MVCIVHVNSSFMMIVYSWILPQDRALRNRDKGFSDGRIATSHQAKGLVKSAHTDSDQLLGQMIADENLRPYRLILKSYS